MRLAVLVVGVALGCGGKAQSTASAGEEGCFDRGEPLSSNEAVEATRCLGVTRPQANLLKIDSTGERQVDENGRAEDWTFMTWDMNARIAGWTRFNVHDGITQHTPTESRRDCVAPNSPASSLDVVPDAAKRFTEFDPFPGEGDTLRIFAFRFEPCMGVGSTRQGVNVVRSRADEILRYRFDYTWEGEFIRACGPCESLATSECDEPCWPP